MWNRNRREDRFEKTKFNDPKIIKKSLLTTWNAERIGTVGYKYLSIFTDGCFNPNCNELAAPFKTHYINLQPTERKIFIYGEMKNIDISNIDSFHYYNLSVPALSAGVANGYGNIYFYLSNYQNDLQFAKEKGTHFERSEPITANLWKYYHFGIIRTNITHELVCPYIPNLFVHLTILYKENNASQNKRIYWLHEDGNYDTSILIPSNIVHSYIPSQRFYIGIQANAVLNTNIDLTIKLA